MTCSFEMIIFVYSMMELQLCYSFVFWLYLEHSICHEKLRPRILPDVKRSQHGRLALLPWAAAQSTPCTEVEAAQLLVRWEMDGLFP